MGSSRVAAPVLVALLGCAVLGCSTRTTGARSAASRRSTVAAKSSTVTSTLGLSLSGAPGTPMPGRDADAAGDPSATTTSLAPRSADDDDAGTTVGAATSTSTPDAAGFAALSQAVTARDICAVNEAMSELPVSGDGTASLLREIRQIRSAIVTSAGFAPRDLLPSWNDLASGVGKVIDALSKPGATARSAASSWNDPNFIEAQQDTERWMNANC